VAQEIINAAVVFLRPHRTKIDALIPVPPSKKNRVIQPVALLAAGIGRLLNLPVVPCVTTTRDTQQIKNANTLERRQELVKGLYAVDNSHTTNKNVLLLDDLIGTGTTMNAISELLLNSGKAKSLRVITIIETRKNLKQNE